MNRWMILQRDYGQLGNRLHTHANALAWCMENNVNLINLSFKQYSHWFSKKDIKSVETFMPRTSNFAYLLDYKFFWKFIDRLSRSDEWLRRLTKIIIMEKKDSEFLSEEELDQSFKSDNRVLLVRAWDVRCPKALENRADEIRQRIQPGNREQAAIKCLIEDIRQSHDILVGLHVRRNDYRTWAKGIHFHSWQNYREWLEEIDILLKKKYQKPGYLICSDESPPKAIFEELPTIIDERSAIIDLYALASCDYLLGPPSSFGTWASFYGKTPRLCLYSNTQIDSLSLFKQQS